MPVAFRSTTGHMAAAERHEQQQQKRGDRGGEIKRHQYGYGEP